MTVLSPEGASRELPERDSGQGNLHRGAPAWAVSGGYVVTRRNTYLEI